MDASGLVIFLAIGTLVAVLVVAAISKSRTEARRHDPNAPKSTLAKDGPEGGVAMLDPTVGDQPDGTDRPDPAKAAAQAARRSGAPD